ncbi:LuxR C-terminal-related transcriptional regulator [Sphingomonas melonis]|uniref:DNA-binding CsgD family transcriptional regulator n=1 Tax=Sphingomonas melonis TaxID=152682 RepID=A0A7Y9FPT7_9SPHN|nr:LuxR C-terminal-related transcriptional regulator [Sphingomonas melonis]NYD91199.1 DNA-binding CsgD family transcriptional regulator [Sphingomonas melonis]
MSDAPFGLSDREREVLRLLARGHDAKSAAAALNVSVHTVNERLRAARAKTGASSSRGAARLLADREGPQEFVPKEMRVGGGAAASEQSCPPRPGATDGSRLPSQWGLATMITILAAAAMIAGVRSTVGDMPQSVAPKVVRTVPAQGATVAPGPLTLSVTFDRPMRPGSYSFVQKSAQTFPDCGSNQPVQSADGRTFTLRCEVQLGRRYELWFNSPPYMNFTDRAGVPALPFGLFFQTGRAPARSR